MGPRTMANSPDSKHKGNRKENRSQIWTLIVLILGLLYFGIWTYQLFVLIRSADESVYWDSILTTCLTILLSLCFLSTACIVIYAFFLMMQLSKFKENYDQCSTNDDQSENFLRLAFVERKLKIYTMMVRELNSVKKDKDQNLGDISKIWELIEKMEYMQKDV